MLVKQLYPVSPFEFVLAPVDIGWDNVLCACIFQISILVIFLGLAYQIIYHPIFR